MRLIHTVLCLASLVCLQASCDSRKEADATQKDLSFEDLIESRREHLAEERKFIDSYVDKKEWPVTTTGTGLRYYVYHRNDGLLARNGMRAQLEYKLRLLNDSLVYSSEVNGLLDFTIGQDFVETGLHEAMLFLQQGDSAHLVLPSHIAHGLTGDFGRIPPGVPVTYELYVKSVE